MSIAASPSFSPQVRLPTGFIPLPVAPDCFVAHLDAVLDHVVDPENSPAPLVVRRQPASLAGPNPNHHLWNNHGIWFLHCTVYPTKATKERFRRTLQTRCIVEARQRRDALMAELVRQGLRSNSE